MLTIKNWGAKFSLLLLLAWGITGCTPKGPKALLDGKELIESGDHEKAVNKLELATSLIGTNAVAWNYLGLAYHHTGRSTNAEQAYLKALSLDRNLAEAYFNLGSLRLEEQRLDPARTAFIAFTALQANSVDGWVKLATVQMRLREYPAAEKSFQEALQLRPENAEALNGLGLIHVQRRDGRGAAAFFEKSLEAQPDYAPALLNLAVVNHTSLNNRPAALQCYRQYLALPDRPENWESVRRTADLLAQELAPVASRSVQPVTPAATQVVAPVQNRTTNVARLVTNAPVSPAPIARPEPRLVVSRVTATPNNAVAPQAVKLAPEPVVRPAQDVAAPPQPPPTTNRTVTVATVRAPDGAKVSTNKNSFLRQINPMRIFRSSTTNARPATTPLPPPQATVKMDAQSTSASVAFPRYNFRNPATPAAGDSAAAERLFAQGTKSQRAGRYGDATKAYLEATQLDPAYFQAYYNLALSAAANKNLSQALTAYETALAIRPDSLEARYNFAVALSQAGYVPDALREFQKVVARHPNDARAHVGMGNLYAQQLRQPAKAREHYVKALELDPRHPQAPAIRFWLTSR